MTDPPTKKTASNKNAFACKLHDKWIYSEPNMQTRTTLFQTNKKATACTKQSHTYNIRRIYPEDDIRLHSAFTITAPNNPRACHDEVPSTLPKFAQTIYRLVYPKQPLPPSSPYTTVQCACTYALINTYTHCEATIKSGRRH